MRKLIGIGLLASAIAAAGPARAADPGIEAFEAAQQASWNAHDAAAYTTAFDRDASIVAAVGWHWAGQAEAARNLADGFKLVYARARLEIADVRARMLAPDLALVTLGWSITGARTIEGNPQAGEQHGIQTQVLRRDGTGWLILSQQDTAALASAPAAAPASAAPAPASPAPTAFPTTPPPVRRCVMARGNGECLIYGKARPAPAD